MTRVLITGAGSLLGQGLIRSLRNANFDTEIIAVDPSPLSAGLYWTPHSAMVPLAADPSYGDRIEFLLETHRPEAVLVGTDVELEYFALHRQQLEQRYATKIIVSDPDVIRIADDKYLTYQFLKDNGFDFPESCLPDEESVEKIIRSVGFPLIVKPRVGARSVGVSLVHNRDELRSSVASLKDPVIQECVSTDHNEYTAGTLVFDGRCEASIVMRRDLRDGNTYRAFAEEYPTLNEQVRLIAECLQPFGPANFQFRLDDGRVKVFEINARFSGTTPLRVHAGFSEVEMTLRHVLFGEQVVQPTVRNVTILRHWSETVVPTADLIRGSDRLRLI